MMKAKRKNIRFALPAVIAAVICAIGAGYLIFSSSGYHTLLNLHHFKLDGSCMVYNVESGAFLEDTELHIDECQSSAAGAKVRGGRFVIEGYVDAARLEQDAGEAVFYTESAVYGKTGDAPGLHYTIARYENMGDRDQTLQIERVFPEAFLQYDVKNHAALIRLAYGEGGADVRYYAVYGLSDREEAQNYILQNIYRR